MDVTMFTICPRLMNTYSTGNIINTNNIEVTQSDKQVNTDKSYLNQICNENFTIKSCNYKNNIKNYDVPKSIVKFINVWYYKYKILNLNQSMFGICN